MANDQLKLIALDEEDLEVVSSHLQDAVVRVGEMAYLPSRKRFAAILNRFNWEKAAESAANENERRRTALRFDRVLSRAAQGAQAFRKRIGCCRCSPSSFEPGEHPSGYVTLTFSGDASIRLHVECIEAELDRSRACLARALQTAAPGRRARGADS